jgi:hypothetical protein
VPVYSADLSDSSQACLLVQRPLLGHVRKPATPHHTLPHPTQAALLPVELQHHPLALAAQAHLVKLATMAGFAWRQAAGSPSGPHAPLKRWMVDAATVRFSAHVSGLLAAAC